MATHLALVILSVVLLVVAAKPWRTDLDATARCPYCGHTEGPHYVHDWGGPDFRCPQDDESFPWSYRWRAGLFLCRYYGPIEFARQGLRARRARERATSDRLRFSPKQGDHRAR